MIATSRLESNILANFAGRGWSALMALAFVPLYLKFMGVEAYGLVGFFATLQALFVVLDLGLSTTLNRELARGSAHPGEAQRMRDLLRTLETVYWSLAIAIGIVVTAVSPLIARYWIRADQIPADAVQQAVMIMGLVIAFQWPLAFYSGGLLGLQRQVLYNVITAAIATLRGGGAVLILWLVSPSVQAYFVWQVVVSALGTGLTALALWRSLPATGQSSHFRKKLLLSVWRFAAGMTAISAVTLLLTQLDKVILSKILSLEMFGYYSLAWVVANGLYSLIGPVFAAMFPRFSQLVMLGDKQALRELYHSGCQLMSVIVLPVAVVVALFSPEILLIWTGDIVAAARMQALVSVLVAGTAMNGLMNLPYALQLAHGWTSLALHTNMVSIVFLVPLILLLTSHYGAIGAATVWALLNASYVVIGPQIMHRRILAGDCWRWYYKDVGQPLVAVLSAAILCRAFFPAKASVLAQLGLLSLILTIATLAAAWVTPTVRNWMKRVLVAKATHAVRILSTEAKNV